MVLSIIDPRMPRFQKIAWASARVNSLPSRTHFPRIHDHNILLVKEHIGKVSDATFYIHEPKSALSEERLAISEKRIGEPLGSLENYPPHVVEFQSTSLILKTS